MVERRFPPFTLLFVIADDVGREDLATVSALGGTPNLDALAARGFTFTGCISAPVCSPTRRQMLFGDWHARVSQVCQPPDGTEPPFTAVSLAETGHFRSALFGKWHIGSNPTGGPWELTVQAHGFDVWRGLPHYVAACGGFDYDWWPRVEDGVFDLPFGLYQPRWMLQRTLAYLDQRPGGLVVFSAQLAHEPYHRPPSSLLPPGWPAGATDRQKYWAMIASLDLAVGRLVERLTPFDVVVFVGDNGTPDEIAPLEFRSKAKGTTFERGLRVPLILAGGGIKAGTSDALVSVVDLYATLAELLGAVSDPERDSRSLLPLLHGADKVRDFAYAGLEGDARFPDDTCARSSRFKLRQLDFDRDGITDREEFYDLLVDPRETENRITDPGLAAEIDAHRSWLLANKP